MALIELTEVTKRYRVGEQEIAALDGVNLSIEAGEHAAMVSTPAAPAATACLSCATPRLASSFSPSICCRNSTSCKTSSGP